MSGALFLSAPEVAETLGIPPSTLRYWAWSDTAPTGFPSPVKIGHRVRYPRAQFIEWVSSQIEGAQSAGEGS